MKYRLRNITAFLLSLTLVLMSVSCEKDNDLTDSLATNDTQEISSNQKVSNMVKAIMETKSYPDGTTTAQAVETRSDLSIAEYLGFKPELSSLLAAVNRFPDLAEALSDSEVQLTVFIPENNAFAALLNAAGFASLDDVPDEVLLDILQRHVLMGFMGIPELDMYEETMQMVDFDGGVPANIFIQKFGSTSAIVNGGAAVTRDNLFVGRSILHQLGQVIPASNLANLIQDNPNFSMFVEAINRDDLERDLLAAMMTGGPFTIFVPTNAAFQARMEDADADDLDDISGAELTRILQSHILQGNFRADELMSSVSVETTLPGAALTFEMNDDGSVQIINDNGTATVLRANIQGENGVAHAIDAVFNFDDTDSGTMDVENALYVSSNTSGTIGIFNATESGLRQLPFMNVMNEDADGIFYDEDEDILYQLDRTNNRINAYENASTIMGGEAMMPSFTSTSDFTNGREIAVSNNRIVVAQDAADSNGGMNRFLVYEVEGNSITLTQTFDSPINLWGIQLVGDDMYAIEDNSPNLVIYEDFFDQDDMLEASTTVTIQGIIRTHGIAYDADNDIMVLTDVGSGASPDDGAIHVINDFSDKAEDGGTITLNQQTRMAGSNTFLGNPVDVAFSEELDMIYVAERANGGGRVLVFAYPTVEGNVLNWTPLMNIPFAGASAVYLNE
ncbi:MAG: fasciclin domain-containing protein [Bacteroidota bacterium]